MPVPARSPCRGASLCSSGPMISVLTSLGEGEMLPPDLWWNPGRVSELNTTWASIFVPTGHAI